MEGTSTQSDSNNYSKGNYPINLSKYPLTKRKRECLDTFNRKMKLNNWGNKYMINVNSKRWSIWKCWRSKGRLWRKTLNVEKRWFKLRGWKRLLSRTGRKIKKQRKKYRIPCRNFGKKQNRSKKKKNKREYRVLTQVKWTPWTKPMSKQFVPQQKDQ